MSINIYVSRQSAGKNPAREEVFDKILKSYKEASFKEKRKIFVLTPRQNTYQVERELIEKSGKKGLLGLQITDLESLILRIINEEVSGLEVLDSHGRFILMQKALYDTNDSLTIYKSSSNRPEFTEQVIDQISELKLADISEEQFEKLIETFDGTLLSDKIKDLSLIYKNFSESLGENRFDEEDLKMMVYDLLEDSSLIKDAQIFIVDMNNFTLNEVNFLVQASKFVKDIVIAINSDENPIAYDISAFSIANYSLSLFRQLAKQNHIKLNIENLPLSNNESSLDFLASELFSFNPKRYKGEDLNVSLFNAKDQWEEVTRVAQLILKDFNSGKDFSKIAVITNDRNGYESIITRIFRQYGIPYFIDENHQVTDNHFIQFVLSALEVINSKFSRNELLNYLKNDFSGFDNHEVDLLENYLIEAGIKPYEWKKDFKRLPKNWKKDIEELTADHKLNELRKKVIAQFKIFEKEFTQENTFNFYIDHLINFLEKLESIEKLEELSNRFSDEGEQQVSLRYRQIWNILLEVLEQIRAAFGDTKTSFTEFTKILKAGLSTYDVGVLPEDDEAVIVSSLDRIRLPEIDNLYFLGLNEGLIPKSVQSDNFFSDYDKELIMKELDLNNFDLKNSQYRHELETSNFYSLITKPKEKIVFSYFNLGKDGTDVYPSRYVDVLAKIFGKNIYRKKEKIFDLLAPNRAQAILETFNAEDNQFKMIQKSIKEWFEENEYSIDSKIFKNDHLKGQDRLDTYEAFDLYRRNNDKIRVSVSRLESFAQCPFKHFISYGLRPAEREEYEVRSLDTGIIVHEVFNQFLKELSALEDEEYRKALEEYIRDEKLLEDAFERIFNEVFKALEESNRYHASASSRYLIKKIKRICLNAIRIIILQLVDSTFKPIAFEESFRDYSNPEVTVEGRIDRVDLRKDKDGNYLRIIDYKTGNKEIDYTDLFYGKALQLALYLTEATEKFERKYGVDVSPSGAFYFLADKPLPPDTPENAIWEKMQNVFRLDGIKKKMNVAEEKTGTDRNTRTPNNLSDDEFEELLKFSKRKVNSLIEDLKNGDISINPIITNSAKTDACAYCSYKDICRFNPKEKEFSSVDQKELSKTEFFEKIGELNE